MRAVLQRVSGASVSVDGQVVGSIEKGLLVLLGVGRGDRETEADRLATKVANLRIFQDAAGRSNLSLLETGGSVLVVSQFTLYADTKRGRRPSFGEAAEPAAAAELVEYFRRSLASLGVPTATGRFAAHMVVTLVNDGPYTIFLDTGGEGRAVS